MRAQTRRVIAAMAHTRAEEEPAGEHVRNAIQILSNMIDFGALDSDARRQLRAANERLWRALREMEKGNV